MRTSAGPDAREKIDAEAQLDGIYIVRTSLDASEIGASEAGGGVQESLPGGTGVSLAQDGTAGPAPRIRLQRGPMCADTSFCVCWRITWSGTCGELWRRCCSRRRIGPGARALRKSPVEKAQVSERTKAKGRAQSGRLTGSRYKVYGRCWRISARSPLNQVTLPNCPRSIRLRCLPSQRPCRAKAFNLLGVDPTRFVASKWPG